MTKRLQLAYDGTPRLHMTSYSDAYLWDGQPEHQTGLGWGH